MPPSESAHAARAAESMEAVPMMLVSRKAIGPEMLRSTWLSAARCMTESTFSSFIRAVTPSVSRMSILTNRWLGAPSMS